MTTIRVTRRTASPPVTVEAAAAPEPGRPAENAGAGAVRLELVDPPARGTTLDGAWWPRTQDLSHEVPGLVEELHRRGIRVTRVGYHPAAWDPAPRRSEADGRTIRLDWFRSMDPRLLNLTGDPARGRLDLLVIPPGTTAGDAERAFAAAGDRADRQPPSTLLDPVGAAGPPVERPARTHD